MAGSLIARFSICVPDGTTNYVTNPALRYDTTGWNAAGSTITRSLEQARFGVASLKVVTNGSVLREGAFFRVNDLSGINEPITVSAYVRGAGRVRIRVISNPTGKEWISDSILLRSDRWTRLSATGQSIGSNDVRLYVELDEATANARTFYVDGAQMERKAYATTYCDGDQDGCRWNGVYHNSTATRSPYTRAGGRFVQLAGEQRAAEDLYMTVAGGLGAAPLVNNLQSFALAPGAYFQNSKIQPRVMIFTFFAKHVEFGGEKPVSLQALHQLRQFLIDVVKPDRTVDSEEILFEYQDGDKPIYFKARYDGGLEGDWDIRNQWINSFPLRLLAGSPLMFEDSQDVASLDIQDSISQNFTLARIDGVWNRMNFGLNDFGRAMAIGNRGEIYLVGDNGLTVANNNAAAVDPLLSVRAIVYWDGTKWQKVGTSTAALGGGGQLNEIAVSPNGDLYVTGDFSSIGGVAANSIARWNGSAWSALGTGLNAGGTCVAVAPNGDVYVGGLFTTAGGVACLRVARWDGVAWRRLGQYGGLNSTVNDLAISVDGTRVYVGGAFTDENGNPGSNLTRVASYNVSTGLFSRMGNGVNASPDTLELSPSGIVYVGGAITASGSDAINGIAQWNGSTWVSLGSGLLLGSSASLVLVRAISFFSDESLLVAGNFDRAGGISVNKMAMWNGSVWVNLDLKTFLHPTTEEVTAAIINPLTDDIYLWLQTAHVVNVSGVTLVNNSGTAEVSPVVFVSGSGTLRWLENQSTQKRLYLNLTVLANEEVFIDFGAGKMYSSIRGNLFYTLAARSDFKTFTLIPGENKIACLTLDDVGQQVQISYRPQHWGADATQNEASL